MSNKHSINLKSHGFKVTQPRLEILNLFEKNRNNHFSPDNIYSELKGSGSAIGIATVYRILNQFENAGIINKLTLNNSQVMYELNQGEHHDHMICMKCDNIIEFYNDEIEILQEKIARSVGAKIIDHSLNLYIECSECIKKGNN